MKKIDPVPPEMAHLPLDRRGYPIPFVVLITEDEPHFVINDAHKQILCQRDDLCGICGRKLDRARWFVGGIRNAFDPRGAYIDPPMHDACAHYALRVCPFLAMPSYGQANI